MKFIRIVRSTKTPNLTLLLVLMVLAVCLHSNKGVSAQESFKSSNNLGGFDSPKQNDSASRLKAMEVRLKKLETRLQALEKTAPTKGDSEVHEEKASPTLPTVGDPSLAALGRHLEALEKRLDALEMSASSEQEAAVDRSLTSREDKFHLSSPRRDDLEVHIGATLQTDYRYYQEEARADNRFDIRRARLSLTGSVYRLLGYRFEYEFQGSESNELLDAYGQFKIYGPHTLRYGQFKEPFSLEWQTKDKDVYFAERSMGYFLSPNRDVGLMIHGSFFEDTFDYSFAVFNGDGTDGSSRGSQSDEPEFAGRLVFAPFGWSSFRWMKAFQIGGSATRSSIDLANIDLEVKSTGMVGTSRNLYVLNSNTKFGVLYEAGERRRNALEAAWAWGPVALQGEHFHMRYTDLKPATGPLRHADFSSWYASAVVCLTGEEPEYSGGIFQPIKPKKHFDPSQGAWGAVTLGVRLDQFYGDEDWITDDAFVSVKEADAWTIALNWILNPAFRLTVDYTETDLSEPVRVRVNPDGTVDYVDKECVVTVRSQLSF